MERIKTIHGRFQCKAPKKPPTIEFDLDVGAWYLRFSNARIAKTIYEEKPGVIFAIDLDSKKRNSWTGAYWRQRIQHWFVEKDAPIDTSKVDFEKARFVHAAKRDLAEA